MDNVLKLLLVEDSEFDADLILREFEKAQLQFDYTRVTNQKDLELAILNFRPDLVITDFMIPGYSGMEATRYLKKSYPEIPIIMISGTVGEEIAVEAMKNGACDYLTKENLFRLVPATLREIAEAQVRVEKRITEEKLKLLNEELEQRVKQRTEQLEELNKRLYEEIEERKKKELEIQASSSRFTRLFQVSPIAMSISRLSDNIIIDINNSYLELLEYSREELIGRDPTELNIWVNPEQRVELINQVIRFGTVTNKEIKVKSKTGKIRIILLSIEYLFADENEPWLLFMGMNIDEIKKAEEEIFRALEKEKELNLLKNRFVSMISHEIRTPLTSIMLSTDLLRRHSESWEKGEREKYLDKIQQTVLKITRLLENVLTISRMEAGQFDYHSESIDLIEFCKSTAENVEFNYNSKNHIKVLSIGDSRELIADENLLGLAITNLLNNAVKYSKVGDDIIIEIIFESSQVHIKIIDKGIGIPKEELHYLFQSFFRASNVGNISGYGIGLSIVKKCIEAHKGTIDVESKVGKGTTFHIFLPIIKDNQ